jgi:glucose-1-phosphate adenylyltransferase
MQRHHPEYVLVLGGDHVYTMDYSEMLLHHVQSGADFTVGSIEVPVNEASAFGVMSVDEDMRITHFAEKPKHPDSIPGKPGIALVSMGIYIFSKDFLYKTLNEDAGNAVRTISARTYPANIARAMAFPPATGRRAVPTGATWHLSPAGRPIWNCARWNRLNLYNREWPI